MILVTGASGTNGRNILHALASLNVPVRAMVRDPDKAADLRSPGVTIVRADFDDEPSLGPALAGCDTALLLSAVDEAMVGREGHFIRAAKAAGVRHIVRFSAIGAEAPSRYLMQRMHGEGEEQIKKSGIGWTFLRPTFFMQNMLWNAGSIKAEGKSYGYFRDGAAAHVDVRDIGAVAARVLADPARHAGEAYVITGPAALTNAQLAQVLSKVLEKKVEYVDVPREAYLETLIKNGQPRAIAQGIVDLDHLVFEGVARRVTDTVKRIGQKEPIAFERFVRDHRGAFVG
jgi:uncharacterized protein YbjT (DUF2867 family)